VIALFHFRLKCIFNPLTLKSCDFGPLTKKLQFWPPNPFKSKISKANLKDECAQTHLYIQWALDLISKASLKDKGAKTHLYIQQPENMSNVRLQTNFNNHLTPSLGLASNFHIATLHNKMMSRNSILIFFSILANMSNIDCKAMGIEEGWNIIQKAIKSSRTF